MSSKNTSNHSNQCNPNSSSYQGHTSSYSGSRTTSDYNNHSNQINPNNNAYSSSRGGNSGNTSKKWCETDKFEQIKWFLLNLFF